MRSTCRTSYTHIFRVLDSYYAYVATGATLNSFPYEVPFSHYGILEILVILCWIRCDVLLKRAVSIWPTNALNWVSFVGYCKMHFFLGIEFQRNSSHDTSFIFRTFQKSETRGVTAETKIRDFITMSIRFDSVIFFQLSPIFPRKTLRCF